MSSAGNRQTEIVIARALAFKERGTICQAEMWNIISGHLADADVASVKVEALLDRLSEATQRRLAAQCPDPHYLNYDAEIRSAIFAWILLRNPTS
jgi:hypothetical protein